MGWPQYVGVVGAGDCPGSIYHLAEILGSHIAKMGWVLVCGGLGGVMEAAAKGCAAGGGMTVGLLPGLERESANPHIRIPIPTGLGEGRNLLVVRASDLIFAVAGGHGTLSEIALALKTGKPVVGLETWKDISGIAYAVAPEDAIQKARDLLKKV
jgi:uncharacterized protein (TIGR00725 family)